MLSGGDRLLASLAMSPPGAPRPDLRLSLRSGPSSTQEPTWLS